MNYLNEFDKLDIAYWKGTAEWNITVVNVLDKKKRIKFAKNEDENFKFLCKKTTDFKNKNVNPV